MFDAFAVLIGFGILIRFFFEKKREDKAQKLFLEEQSAKKARADAYINQRLEDDAINFGDPLADLKLYRMCKEYIKDILGEDNSYFWYLEDDNHPEENRTSSYHRSGAWFIDVRMLLLIYLSRFGYLPSSMVLGAGTPIKSGSASRLKDTIKILENVEDVMARYGRPVHFVMNVPKYHNHEIWKNGFYAKEFYTEYSVDAPHDLVRINDLMVK